MKRTNLKYYIGIILILIFGNIQGFFFNDYRKFDIYLLYDHKRYLSNIIYDLSTLFDFSILTYFLSTYNRTIFKPLFILSLFTWVSYFVFYNQIGSLILIPIYLLLVVCYNRNI